MLNNHRQREEREVEHAPEGVSRIPTDELHALHHINRLDCSGGHSRIPGCSVVWVPSWMGDRVEHSRRRGSCECGRCLAQMPPAPR